MYIIACYSKVLKVTKCLPLTDLESSSITFKMFKPVKEKQKYTQPTHKHYNKTVLRMPLELF